MNGTGGELCAVIIDVGDLGETTLSQVTDAMREECGYDVIIAPGDSFTVEQYPKRRNRK